MKTLIFDLRLNLRGISDEADARLALIELDGKKLIDRSSERLSPDDWNFVRVPDDVANEISEWQACGAPIGVSPFKNMVEWRKYKVGRRSKP